MLKRFKAITLVVVFVCVAMSAVCVFADPADSTTPYVYTQPDGTTVEIYNYGDEWYHFKGDSDGYLLEKDEDGYFNYVTVSADSAVDPASNAGSTRPANAVRGFDLAPDPSEIYRGDESPVEEEESSSPDASVVLSTDSTVSNVTYPKKAVSFAKPTYGDRKLMVIVVDFNDIATDLSVHTPQSMADHFFSTEEGKVSVSNYYLDQSGGRFTYVPAFKMSEVATSAADGKAITDTDLTDGIGVIADGFMKIKVDVNHPNNGLNENFIEPSMTLLDEYIDFSQFDTDGNGRIAPKELTVFFWASGYNVSCGLGASDDTVKSFWAHCSSKKLTYDNTKIFYYKEEPYSSAGVMYDENQILLHGTIVHELGHTLDLPDYYDTPEYGYINIMSLMGAGSKGRLSTTGKMGELPASFDAWTILHLGWYSDDDLLILDADDKGTYGVVSRYSEQKSDPSKGIYRYIKVNTSADSKEYYIIENRLFKGYDRAIQFYPPYVQEEGIAVWRIDESKFNSTHPIYLSPNKALACGLRFMANGMTITGANSSNNLTIKSFNSLYNTKYPLWSKKNNRFSFLGKQSYPDTAYVTVPDGVTDTNSGVALKFLSGAGEDVAMVQTGENDLEELVYTSSGSTKMYVFNNMDTDTSTVPFIAEYSGNALTNLVNYGRTALTAGSYATTASKSFAFNSSKKYDALFVDFPSLKSYYVESESEGGNLPGTDETLAFSLDTSGALSGVSTDATVMTGSKIKFVKPVAESGNTIVYYNNGVEITDGIEDMGTSIALPVTNKGENAFVAVEYNGTTAVRQSAEVVVTGENLINVNNDTSTTATTWPAETVYAGYLAENSGATAEQIATAQKLYGYVDGTATRIPSQGTTTASAGLTINFEEVDYAYYNLDLYINGSLASETPWFLRFGGNYWRIRNTDNHILLDKSSDTGVALKADEWQAVTLLLDGTDVDIYVNGILEGKSCVDYSATSVKLWEGSTKPDYEPNLYEDRASFARGSKNIE